jgi:TnpA family transposase
VARLRNGNKQYFIYPAIKFAKKMLSNLIIKKKIIDTSIVIPVRDVA